MEILQQAIDIFLHLDTTLNHWAACLGGWLYAILFLIVFCETGLVVTPFLPGDSLLFAVGALGSTENSTLSMPVVTVALIIAAILGDSLNYAIGYRLGPKIFQRESSWLLNKKHLNAAQAFYVKHGGKTIVLGRFLPIIRTFAPFVAGIAKMNYSRFLLFNVAGAVVWVGLLVLAGYVFGQVPIVKNNFEIVIVAVIVISILPAAIEFTRSFLRARKQKQQKWNVTELNPVPEE